MAKPQKRGRIRYGGRPTDCSMEGEWETVQGSDGSGEAAYAAVLGATIAAMEDGRGPHDPRIMDDAAAILAAFVAVDPSIRGVEG